jgi:hypothetical protein
MSGVFKPTVSRENILAMVKKHPEFHNSFAAFANEVPRYLFTFIPKSLKRSVRNLRYALMNVK